MEYLYRKNVISHFLWLLSELSEETAYLDAYFYSIQKYAVFSSLTLFLQNLETSEASRCVWLNI